MAALALLASWCGPSLAQTAAAMSAAELSKEAENPVSRWITLPLRYEAEFDSGPYRAVKDTFKISQAIVPFVLDEDWAVITRTNFPLEAQPPKKGGEHWAFGLANSYTTFFLSPEHGEGFFWGVGPVLYYPTATNHALGVNHWGTGPSAAVVLKYPGPWEFAAVVNNIWSLGGGPGSSDRTNSLLLNPMASYHFEEGWSLTTSPNITANWLARPGEQWTVPIGGGIGKTFRNGDGAIKLSLAAYYNAIRPQASNDAWLAQVTLTFVIPK
jgi:hypothetical protein